MQRRVRVDTRKLERFFQKVATELDHAEAVGTLVLVSDKRMQDLNRFFRGIDRPTDVLSFSTGPGPSVAGEPAYLGDIVISVETARRQALRRGSNLARELRVLTLHGFLHLLGYDHETDEGEMRRLEYRLRKKLAITRPPKARSASPKPRRKKRTVQ